MKRLKIWWAVPLLTLLWGIVPAAQSAILGDWELTFTTPQGSHSVNVTFAQEGEKITANLISPIGSVQLSGAEAPDGTVKMTGTLTLQNTTMELALGARVTGETLDGLVTFGPLGELPFTGKRPDKTAAAPPAEASPNAATGVSGVWNITLTVPNVGDFPAVGTFNQDGDKVTGTLMNFLGEAPVTGTLTGDELRLEFTAQTPQGGIAVTLTGRLDGAGLKGKAVVTGLGDADWTAVRAPR